MNDVPRCDLLLFVTTQSEEEALVKVAKDMEIPTRKEESKLGAYFDLGSVGADRVLAVRTRMGAIQYGASASRAILFQGATGASGIVQVGMAFGVRSDEQRCGDVLVATRIIPYDERDVKVVNGVEVTDYERARPRAASGVLVERFVREKERARHGFGVHVGALLSGGARIFSRRYRDHLVANVPPTKEPIVGGEMEGVGLVAVCAADKPIWCVVKAISDFADETRDGMIETTRTTACENAIRFVLSTLKRDHGTV